MKKIFLDDIRQPNECAKYMHTRIGKYNSIYLEDWVIVRNYDEFVLEVSKNFPNISHISFDHDLADIHYDPSTGKESFEYDEKTGYDAAKWLKDYYKNNAHPLPILYVHSMNPVGTQNIINVFK